MDDTDKQSVKEEFEKLSGALSDPRYLSNPAEYQRIAKRYNELKKLVPQTRGLETKEDRIIIEIRSGAGGDEASLFSQELFRMYSRFIEKKGWKIKILSSRRSELKGLKEITFEVSGKGARKMKNESGVHRVQRIPETEKSGRIHTSTVSVAVLPKAREVDIEIKPEDIRIDTYRSSGPGGQYVNKTSSAVRITHLPTGIVVSSQEGRLQQENRELAMEILRARLLKQKREEEEERRGNLRKRQIGSAERSEKVRTYNFPQDRLTDHRIQKSWHNLDSIMDGNIEEILDALSRQAEES